MQNTCNDGHLPTDHLITQDDPSSAIQPVILHKNIAHNGTQNNTAPYNLTLGKASLSLNLIMQI